MKLTDYSCVVHAIVFEIQHSKSKMLHTIISFCYTFSAATEEG